MRISKKLIANTCLPIYEDLLEKGKKDNTSKFLNRLTNNNAQNGICLLYSENSNIGYIYTFKPLFNLLKTNNEGNIRMVVGGTYYYKIPLMCDTKKEMIDCINKRIELLKSWL